MIIPFAQQSSRERSQKDHQWKTVQASAVKFVWRSIQRFSKNSTPRFMSSVDVVSPGTSTRPADRRQTKARLRKTLLIVAMITAAILFVAAVLCAKYWPFSEKAVQEDLAEASDSTVIIHGYHPTYFPTPGCVLEKVEFRHGPNQFEIIAIDKLRIQGSYP